MKRMMNPKLKRDGYTHMLIDRLWNLVKEHNDVECQIVIPSNTWMLLFVAAQCGNEEFLVEMIGRYPDFIHARNDMEQSIFHVAILHRFERIFSLIYELGCFKNMIATSIDSHGNNMLHLAATLGIEAQNQLNLIPGAALQMQRAVLWFKEVEKIVPDSFSDMKNNNNQTPHELFLEQFGKLMKEGEVWMKQTSQSCMVVVTLLCTMLFTAAFTLPGGYDNATGAPILSKEPSFVVFTISEAVGMFSSSASMLMFLAILTSRYAEMDFLKTLPILLMTGLVTLFVSVAAVVVAFCSAFQLFFNHHHGAITEVITWLGLSVFAAVPLIYILLKYPLLMDVFRSTCGSLRLFRSKNRLFKT